MKKKRSNGFTLIEILVVLTIMSILLGVVLVVGFKDSDQRVLYNHAEKLQSLLQQIRNKALISNIEYGFSIDEKDKYVWWKFNNDQQLWQKLKASSFLAYQPPNTMNVLLQLNHNDNTIINEDESQPTVIFFSDWQVTPFSLSITLKQHSKTVVINTDGFSEIKIQ